MKKVFLAPLIVATAVLAADQTHYDLIRPVYPMTWDTSAVADGGTVYSFSKFVPPTSENSVRLYPADGAKPAEFKPNGIISDTLDQAFIDALSLSMSDIRVNQAGYLPSDPEQLFYYFDKSGSCSATYSVVDMDGKEVATGGTFTTTGYKAGSVRNLKAFRNSLDVRYTVADTVAEKTVCKGNLTNVAVLPTNKRLRIKVGQEFSSTFIISDEIYSMVRDASLKFFGAQRSGNSESWFHGPSHMKDGEGKLTGGWYDGADHIKSSTTMSYTLMVLAVMTATEPNSDDDHYAYNHNEVETTDGVPDVLREAKHGADFYLKSFAYADGEMEKMVAGVGDFSDHNVWLRCDSIDNYSYAPERTLFAEDLVPPVAARIAAGLALLSRTYAKYDKDFADSCLMVAEKLYEYAKATVVDPFDERYQTNMGAYNEAFAYDDLAGAAIALHYATYEKSKKKDYLNDAIYDETISDNINAKYDSRHFKAGWFGNTSGFNPGAWPNDYSGVQNFVMYAFYKLILIDEKTSESYGIGKDERLSLIEKILLSYVDNLSDIPTSANPVTIDLKALHDGFSVSYNGLHFSQFDAVDIAGFYFAVGPLVNYLMYAKIADDLVRTKTELPALESVDWKSSAIWQIALNRLNYMLGMNEWDMSFMVGVGDKNESHVHHRTSNPEFANAIISKEFEKRKQEMMDTLDLSKYTADEIKKLEDDLMYELNTPTYSYRPLTGALVRGPVGDAANGLVEGKVFSDVENFVSTDVSLWNNAEFLAALMLLSKEHSTAAAPDTSKSDTSAVKTDTSTVKTDTTVTKDSTDKKDSGDKKDKDKKDNVPESPKFVQNLNVVKLGSMLEVNYSLNVAAPATVKLVSVSGNVVRNYNGGNLGAGSHTVSFDMSEVPAGIYIVKVGAGSLSETRMIKLAE